MTATFSTINNVQADAHAFRVTLNIILNSTNCPFDLEAVIENLRDEYQWNRHKLSSVELQSIYAHLDSDLCADALSEWNVESHRMRDWGFPFWRSDHHDWWDGEHQKVDCRLCGHRDNRYEFPLVNTKTGREIWTGSTCIVKFGVTVDGDACAETALQKLRDIMGRSKNAQKRSEWQDQHPKASVTIDKIRAAMPICNRKYLPWSVRRASDEKTGLQIIPANFTSQRRLLGKWGRATIKYFDRHEMLTPKRTHELWEKVGEEWVDGAMANLADTIVAKYTEAEESSDEGKARKYWTKFISDHPDMNDYQMRMVKRFMEYGYSRSGLYARNSDLIKEIEDQHKASSDPATKKPTGLSKVPWV